MALTYAKLFEPAQLTTSLVTFYTVAAMPSTNLLRNGRVRLSNTTAGAVSADVHAVPSGGSASDVNALAKGVSVPANSSIDVDLPIMKVGDFLQAKAGAATSISIHAIDGVVFS